MALIMVAPFPMTIPFWDSVPSCLQLHQQTGKDLKGIPKKDVRRMLKAIQGLAEDPRPSLSAKLLGDDRYRLRSGVYRCSTRFKMTSSSSMWSEFDTGG